MHEIGLERQEDGLLLRPYVICHMGISLDGRVTGDFLSHPACAEAVEAYYQVNRSYAGDAFACRNAYALEIDYHEQPPMFQITDTHYAATWLLDPRAPKVESPMGGKANV